jgi:hypothetical protein
MLKVYGASDDLIELDGNFGDVNEEIGLYPKDNEAHYLAFSDGTVLRVVYDEDGIWRLTPIFKGALYDRKEDGVVSSDTNDVVYFHTGVKWCVCGKDLAK